MRDLYTAEGSLTPMATKTHVSLLFYVADDYERLNIAFTYGPKMLDDESMALRLLEKSSPLFLDETEPFVPHRWKAELPLKNLVTLSLDDALGFRGAAHRHAPEQHLFVTEREASPGLIPGPLPSGMWRITLSVHAIVTFSVSAKGVIWFRAELYGGVRDVHTLIAFTNPIYLSHAHDE